MTLTKNSTNYLIQDTFGEVNVNGNASINEDKSINININADNGEYASYTKNADGFINFSASYKEASNMIDYMQTLVEEVITGIAQ